jgi:hypothetical protein
MFGNSFYNETTRRYVAIFGTLFNDIQISRKDNDKTEQQRFTVPISYGPSQKFLAKIKQDPKFDSPAIALPRMSFEIVGMAYDSTRKLNTNVGDNTQSAEDAKLFRKQFVPAPYNIEFEMSIMAKYSEDGLKIIEQILPYFKPQWTVSVKLVDDLALHWDIPIELNSINVSEEYEGTFEERRVVMWTLNFTMRGYYLGPSVNKKVIKFANTSVYGSLTANTALEKVTAQPGLTANGEPTTDVLESIDYQSINFDDEWAYIVNIEDAT